MNLVGIDHRATHIHQWIGKTRPTVPEVPGLDRGDPFLPVEIAKDAMDRHHGRAATYRGTCVRYKALDNVLAGGIVELSGSTSA